MREQGDVMKKDIRRLLRRLRRSLRDWISGEAWQGLAARCLTSATIVADGKAQPFAQLHAVFAFL